MAPEPTVQARPGRSPEAVDRLMVGICGAIWLVLLAASVFATVALVRLGSGPAHGGDRESSWLLYSIIAVSALVILAAIPLLIRARRGTPADDARDGAGDDAPDLAAGVRRTEPATEKIRVFGVDPDAGRELQRGSSAGRRAYHARLDRVWLRGTTALLGAMGLAYTAVAVGTYLLTGAGGSAPWVAFGLAGALAIAMVGVLAFYQGQLREVVEAGE